MRRDPQENLQQLYAIAEAQSGYFTAAQARQAVRWIAQHGGFLARKRAGEPGVTVIWRGWQRLQDIAATWHLVKDQPPLVGNR